MCTLNIALDDALVDSVRLSFADENSMKVWVEDQVSAMMRNVLLQEKKSQKVAAFKRLYGCLKSDINYEDMRAETIREKYGV